MTENNSIWFKPKSREVLFYILFNFALVWLSFIALFAVAIGFEDKKPDYVIIYVFILCTCLVWVGVSIYQRLGHKLFTHISFNNEAMIVRTFRGKAFIYKSYIESIERYDDEYKVKLTNRKVISINSQFNNWEEFKARFEEFLNK